MRLPFATGFGPFEATDDNPSAWLAEYCGAEFSVLKVTFAAVDHFVDSFDASGSSALVLMGYANREKMSMELVARNQIGPHPDVDGVTQGPCRIESNAPAQLSGGLWSGLSTEAKAMEELDFSDDAGDYLCNYLYFRCLRKWPHLPIGFLHVPSFETIGKDRQLAIVRLILAECGAAVR